MSYFPLCVDLEGKTVLLIGNGPQTRARAEKLAAFGAVLSQRDMFRPEDLHPSPVLVAAGDLGEKVSEEIYAVCVERGIPVNVADKPSLCTFFFPATAVSGDAVLAVSTSGKCPGAAKYLCDKLSATLPDRTDEIIDWLSEQRTDLKKRFSAPICKRIMTQLTEASFSQGRPLTNAESARIIDTLTAETDSYHK